MESISIKVFPILFVSINSSEIGLTAPAIQACDSTHIVRLLSIDNMLTISPHENRSSLIITDHYQLL